MPFSVPGVPPRKAFVDFPSGISVRPNDTFTTGLVRKTNFWLGSPLVMDSSRSREFLEWPFQLLQFPDITYEADSDELHTVLIADLDIYQPGSPIKNYIHFMATNVPGEKLRTVNVPSCMSHRQSSSRQFEWNWNTRSWRPARWHQLPIPSALRLSPRREQHYRPWRQLWPPVRRSRVPAALPEEGHVAKGGQLVLLKGSLRKAQGKHEQLSLDFADRAPKYLTSSPEFRGYRVSTLSWCNSHGRQLFCGEVQLRDDR